MSFIFALKRKNQKRKLENRLWYHFAHYGKTWKIIPYLKPNAIVIIHDWCLRTCYHCVLDYFDLVDSVDDTEQTIATFRLKPNWKDIKGYDINLGTFERLKK